MMLFFRAAPFAIALLAVPALAANPATLLGVEAGRGQQEQGQQQVAHGDSVSGGVARR